MGPTTSFWDNFSREGRIKKLWVEALRETDREKGLILLRTVRDKMCEPPALVHLWLPFLDTFLARERVQFLKKSDLTDVEEMGKFLQQTPNLQNAPPTFVLWQRVIEAYNTREEYMLACNLAAKVYQDKSADEQTRAYCLRELARQGLIENRYLDMYIAHLRVKADPQTEAEIFQALNTHFTIDFSASDTRLESVNRIAQSLFSFNIPALQTLTPQIWTAEGIYTLLLKAAPEDARDYFKRAIRLNSGDRTAILGLLACEISLGGTLEVTHIAQNPSFRNLLHDPDIAALFDLHKLIQWLNQPEMAGPLPLDAGAVTQLATYPLHRYVGDIAEATLGRLYLLTGNAQLARTHFDILVKKRLRLPNWGYYAAWAYALCGEYASLVDCFRQLINWSGRWTIACMLLDLNPHLAEQCGATTLLKNIAATETPIASVVKSRLVSAQTSLSANSDPWTEAADSLEEALEALRTRLSATIMLKDRETAASLTGQPLFARLPLADQTFWLSLVEHDRARSLSLLQQAAGSWQYQRAALFLVVSSLRQGNWKQADQYLEQALAGRMDLKAQLIRTYIESRNAHVDESIQQCEQLAALVGRGEVEDLMRPIIERTIPYCYRALEEAHQKAGVTLADVDAIILAGGTTHIPLVRDIVRQAFCTVPTTREPRAKCAHPTYKKVDTIVALGAAIRAAAISGLEIYDAERAVKVLFRGIGSTSARQATIGGRVEALNPELDLTDGYVQLRINELGGYEDEQNLKVNGSFGFTRVPLQSGAENLLIFDIFSGNGKRVATVTRSLFQSQEPLRPTGGPDGTAKISKALYLEVNRDGKPYRRELIQALTTLPASKDDVFYHPGDTNRLRLPLYQQKKMIKEIIIDNLPKLPKGTPVDFTLYVDELAGITVKGKVGNTTFETQIEPPPERRPPTSKEVQALEKTFREALQMLPPEKYRYVEEQQKKARESYEAAVQRDDTEQSIHDFEEMEELTASIEQTKAVLEPPFEVFEKIVNECLDLNQYIDAVQNQRNLPGSKHNTVELNEAINMQRIQGEQAFAGGDQTGYANALAALDALRDHLGLQYYKIVRDQDTRSESEKAESMVKGVLHEIESIEQLSAARRRVDFKNELVLLKNQVQAAARDVQTNPLLVENRLRQVMGRLQQIKNVLQGSSDDPDKGRLVDDHSA